VNKYKDILSTCKGQRHVAAARLQPVLFYYTWRRFVFNIGERADCLCPALVVIAPWEVREGVEKRNKTRQFGKTLGDIRYCPLTKLLGVKKLLFPETRPTLAFTPRP